jgi:hypothetical protein
MRADRQAVREIRAPTGSTDVHRTTHNPILDVRSQMA